MTKKLTVFFAVLTAVCVVAAVPLIPFAIRDTSNMLISTIDALDDLETKETVSIPDSTSKLNIRTGNLYVPYLHITHSDSKTITVKSDELGFMRINPKVSTSADLMTIDLNFSGRETYPLPDSPEELRSSLARIVAESQFPSIEICVPDGLVLTLDGNDLDPDYLYIDGDVRYLTKDSLTESDTESDISKPETEQTPSFEQRTANLRSSILDLVRSNAEDSYDQLTFNMHLNDCRIEMEALLMEYAKENGLINYEKYQQQSSAATGISGISGGVSLTPFDSSVNESEARTLIHELSELYLSRLTVQAKLDYTVYELTGDEEDADLLEAKQEYEAQILHYTDAITGIEEMHTDFVMGLMETGLLF